MTMWIKQLSLSALLLLTAQTALAGGVDRSEQSVDFIYDEGSFASASALQITPTVTGRDLLTGQNIDNVTPDKVSFSLNLKYDLNDRWAVGLVKDTPYWATLKYGTVGTFNSVEALLDSKAITAMVRFKPWEQLKLMGGVKYQTLSGNVALPFANNFTIEIPDSDAWGFVVGAAFEMPEIGLRASLDYHSEVEHSHTRRETGGTVGCGNQVTTSTTKIPRSYNINVQTGIAKNTLLFGSARFAQYSKFKVRAFCLSEASLTNYDNSEDYMLGIGHRFDNGLSASLAYKWRNSSDYDPTGSPLTPTNGQKIYSLGLRYQFEKVELSGSVGKFSFGDDGAGLGNTQIATFEGNDAIFGALKVKVNF
uniref:Putative Membrane protein involved in aromatic hydrocarbon degradation n=1 Tax=Magnetococcus massalia (strain MO-1) TaxID=451514 RepID=A0A1S7LKC9_MAGMO|nr:putative Membrane protein involved in aromatic hydrocarbon degradation [Candidatus Magnetococcus massalia]